MLTRRATRRKRSVSFIAAGYEVIRRNGRGRSGPALQARHDCRSLQIRRVQARLIRAEQQDHPRRCIETGADRRRPWKSASSFRQNATAIHSVALPGKGRRQSIVGGGECSSALRRRHRARRAFRRVARADAAPAGLGVEGAGLRFNASRRYGCGDGLRFDVSRRLRSRVGSRLG
jgi:hypothetical protein